MKSSKIQFCLRIESKMWNEDWFVLSNNTKEIMKNKNIHTGQSQFCSPILSKIIRDRKSPFPSCVLMISCVTSFYLSCTFCVCVLALHCEKNYHEPWTCFVTLCGVRSLSSFFKQNSIILSHIYQKAKNPFQQKYATELTISMEETACPHKWYTNVKGSKLVEDFWIPTDSLSALLKQ
jgi:hypothetical protein